MSEPHLYLEIWRLHPNGASIVPADKRLLGEAPPGALKWCGPFTYANRAGWWVYPPLDIDIIYRPPDEGGPYHEKYDYERDCRSENMMHGSFDYHVVEDYEHGEEAVIKQMLRPHHKFMDPQRQLYAFGDVEMNVASIWTGCVFKTPPGWCLHIRSPINIGLDTPFRVQEGILETDWMQYDIWMNLKFTRYNEWVSLRRTQHLPLAQLVPVQRESYDGKWELKDNLFTVDGPLKEEAEMVFDRWNDYNYQKWMRDGRKDPATHHKERKKANKS
jgi:Family of unknown function (DUF6065)